MCNRGNERWQQLCVLALGIARKQYTYTNHNRRIEENKNVWRMEDAPTVKDVATVVIRLRFLGSHVAYCLKFLHRTCYYGHEMCNLSTYYYSPKGESCSLSAVTKRRIAETEKEVRFWRQ